MADAAEVGTYSGTFFGLNDGGVYLGVVENGKYVFRHFETWDGIWANGWSSVGGKDLLPQPSKMYDGYGDPIVGSTVISFKRGNPVLGTAACRPGSTIDNILLPRYGDGARKCNATTSYRCAAMGSGVARALSPVSLRSLEAWRPGPTPGCVPAAVLSRASA